MGTQQVTVVANLKDDVGSPLANEPIVFQHKLSSATAFIPDGSVNTDANGNAQVILPLTTPGTYDFGANWAGNANFNPASASKTGVAFKASATLTLSVA